MAVQLNIPGIWQCFLKLPVRRSRIPWPVEHQHSHQKVVCGKVKGENINKKCSGENNFLKKRIRFPENVFYVLFATWWDKTHSSSNVHHVIYHATRKITDFCRDTNLLLRRTFTPLLKQNDFFFHLFIHF